MKASDFDVDVAVLGSGPGGAAAALVAARRGVRVHVFDPQHGAIDKPCGEGMMPTGVEVLRRLDLGHLVARGRTFPAVTLALAGLEPIEVALPAPGLALERPVLAAELDRELRACARVERTDERAALARRGDGWLVSSRSTAVRARTVVVADGLGGGAAEWLGRERAGGPARLGVRARFRDRSPRAHDASAPVEVHLSPEGEIYLTPLAGGLLNVVVLRSTGADAAGRATDEFARGLAPHSALRARLGDVVTEPEARRLARVRPRRLARDGVFLVGDAGGGVDPILGCGVTVALESGAAAGAACARLALGASHAAESSAYERAYRASTSRRRALAAFLVTLARHPRLARGASWLVRTSDRLPRALVAVAAGDAARVERLVA